MTEKSKKLKKGVITEEDISNLLQRYSANTVLALLQEVAQFEGGVKIDWNALVKKSKTGISNAREYQMLWRHLAYRHSLLERLEDGAQPLDDDSDLEYELEAFPVVSSEASAEASACVKVLIASGLPSDSSHPNNVMVEAPLTINIPYGQLAEATSETSLLPTMRGMNITVPISVQKQSLPATTSAETLDTNGLVNGTIPPRRKRKPWTEAEDLELVAAVQKYGEGNWANIVRSEFTWDRTASQLSQRWAIIRKRIGNLNLATTSSASVVQISEAQRAAQIALNLALDTPVRNTFMNSGEGTSQLHSQRGFGTKASSTMQLGCAAKSQVAVNKPVKPDLSSDPVRATAVAAGARIFSQSDAASLLRAAQAKSAVHIMPAVGSLVKSSLTSGASSNKEVHSNVIFNGLPTPSVSTNPAVSPSGLRPALERASSQTTQQNPLSDAAMNASNTELPPEQDVVNTGGIKSQPNMAKAEVQEHNRASVAGNEPSPQVKEGKAVLPNQETKIKTKESSGESLKAAPKLEVAVAEGSRNGDKISCLSVGKSKNQSPVQCQVKCGNKGNLPSSVADKCIEKLEVGKKEPGWEYFDRRK